MEATGTTNRKGNTMKNMTPEQKKIAREMLATTEQYVLDLSGYLDNHDATSSDWIVMVGKVAFSVTLYKDGKVDKVTCSTPTNATAFPSRSDAMFAARQVFNGNGVQGRPARRHDAVSASLPAQVENLEWLVEAASKM